MELGEHCIHQALGILWLQTNYIFKISKVKIQRYIINVKTKFSFVLDANEDRPGEGLSEEKKQ